MDAVWILASKMARLWVSEAELLIASIRDDWDLRGCIREFSEVLVLK
jgi:hypothetical protein